MEASWVHAQSSNGDIYLLFDGFNDVHAFWYIIYKAIEQIIFPVVFEIRVSFALLCFRGWNTEGSL